MEQLVCKYKKILKLRSLCLKIVISLAILLVFASFFAFIYNGVQENKDMTLLFGIVYFAVPAAVPMLLFFLNFKKDKLMEKLHKDIEARDYSAEDIMLIGQKLEVDLFGLALKVRCRELGIEHAPEGGVRDRVLPTKS